MGKLHYYSDDGILCYQVKNRDLLVNIAKAFNMDSVMSNSEVGEIVLISQGLVYDYGIHEALGEPGLGGCMSVAQWKEEILTDTKKASLKALFIDFLDSGFIASEFVLASIQIWGEIKFDLTVQIT